MIENDGLRVEADLQVKLAQQLMMERTLQVADRMVASLEDLHAQFPSDDVREALRNTIGWRDRLCDWLKGERRTDPSP